MSCIMQLILKYKLKDKVLFEKKTKIDATCVFEGRNRMASRSELYNVKLGFGSYIGRETVLENTDIGKFSCVGPRVRNISGEHPLTYVSMHPAFYSNRKQAGFSFTEKNIYDEFRYADQQDKKSVVVGNDVWIAADVRIIDGVKIGDGAAILAGAVVTKDVPSYAIVGGVPGKVLKYRFEESQIEYLQKLKWWNKDLEWIESHARFFHDLNVLMEQI